MRVVFFERNAWHGKDYTVNTAGTQSGSNLPINSLMADGHVQLWKVPPQNYYVDGSTQWDLNWFKGGSGDQCGYNPTQGYDIVD